MTPRRLRPRHVRAFTLVEVLIATVIFAAIMVALNAVFYGAMRLRSRTTESLERSAWTSLAAGVLQRDLRSIVPPSGVLAGAIKLAAGSGMAQEGRLEIYCSSGAVDPSLDTIESWGDVQKV